MGALEVTVEQEIEGRKYLTTWGTFGVGMGGQLEGNSQDMIALAGDPANYGAYLNDIQTLPETSSLDETYPLLWKILYFHKLMQASFVKIQRIYVHDGKTTLSSENTFLSLPVGINCAGYHLGGDSGNPSLIIPTTNALLIDRVPAGFSSYAGRMFLRACVRETQSRLGGVRGVKLEEGQVGNYNNVLSNSLSQSDLVSHFMGGTQPMKLAVLKFSTVNQPPAGRILSATPVSSMRVNGLTGRQVGRRSRRRTS